MGVCGFPLRILCSRFLNDLLVYLCISTEHSSLQMTLSKLSFLARQASANSRRLGQLACLIIWQYRVPDLSHPSFIGVRFMTETEMSFPVAFLIITRGTLMYCLCACVYKDTFTFEPVVSGLHLLSSRISRRGVKSMHFHVGKA